MCQLSYENSTDCNNNINITFRNEKSLSIISAEDFVFLWCPDPDLNQGHEDFQSSALPTELSGQSL